jgi:hypothetical protein
VAEQAPSPKMSIAEFAAAIKQRAPELESVPDDQLVRGVLERRPEMISLIQTSEPRPAMGGLSGATARRFKSDFNPLNTVDYIGQLLSAINKPPYPHGGGLKATAESLKSTYSKPENVIGDALAMFLMNKLGGGPEPVKSAIQDVGAKTLQRLAGAGREPVLMESLAREQAMAKAQESYLGKLAKVQEQEGMVATQSKYGTDLMQNLKDTYGKVKGKLDARWDQLRSTPTTSRGQLRILKDAEGNTKALKDGITEAEDRFLQGSPGSIRQFRDLVGWIDKLKQQGSGPPTWDELRTHYSAMGDAMYGRPIPNNVYRALEYVRNEVVGKQLEDLAVKSGAGDQYNALLKDHSQFERDWRNTKSVTRGGGSPLAIAMQAPNSATLVPQVTGRTGDLLVKQLAKYQDSGASPVTASAIRKIGTVNPPKQPTPPVTPPEIDPVAIRRQRILEYTSRPKSWYDILPPRIISEPLLSNQRIREFVARYPRKEFPVPRTVRTTPLRTTTSVPSAPSAAEPFVDMATRRGPGEPGPSARSQILQNQMDSLRMQLKQQLASRDPSYWATRNKLQDVEAQYKSLFGTGPSSPTMTSGGGADLNYSAEDLAKLKADLARRYGNQ